MKTFSLAGNSLSRFKTHCERLLLTVSFFARCADFTWITFIIIAACNHTRLRRTEERTQAKGGEGRRGGGKPAPDSAAGCCIPESALMHGLGYVNSHDPMNNVHRVKRPFAASVISNNGASRCDRGKCNSSARYYSPRHSRTPSSREIR